MSGCRFAKHTRNGSVPPTATEKGQPVGLPVVERNGLTEIKGLERLLLLAPRTRCSCCMMRRLTERSPLHR